jgi:hypothetical protein
MPGKPFPHYYLQAIPVIAFLCFDFFIFGKGLSEKFSHVSLNVRLLTSLIVFLSIPIVQIATLYREPDYPAMVAGYLKPLLKAEDSLFVDYKNTVYYLLDREPPTRFVHTTLLRNPEHIKAFAVDLEKEYQHIRSKKPSYMIIEGTGSPHLSDELTRNYTKIKSFEGRIHIYRRMKNNDLTRAAQGDLPDHQTGCSMPRCGRGIIPVARLALRTAHVRASECRCSASS